VSTRLRKDRVRKPAAPESNKDKQRERAGPGPGEVAADRGIEAVAELERAAHETRSFMDRVAASITRKAGSGTAVAVHAIWFLAWILMNVQVFGLPAFDPYPFSLLTTIVSLEAIFLTLFVLISQNRMTKEADRRTELDLQVNLLAEKETTMILRILNEISSHLGTKGTASRELQDLIQDTRLDEISRKLEKALPPDD
jgi:uncharacterized membrane protein